MLEKLPDAVGHALRDQRAGLDKIAFNHLKLRAGTAAITVRSLAFADHAPIPALYTADGDGVSPPLEWTGVPGAAASLVLIVEDADSPTPQPLVHAIVADLPPGDGSLAEGAIDRDRAEGEDATIGRNSYLRAGWLPPDPPPGHGVHRYVFQLFALSAGPGFDSTPGRDAVMTVLQERAIASGILTGTYERPDGSIKVESSEPAAVGWVPGGLAGP
jgi:Raf kinase inhibitor-like YbhB/YbcL family protein